MNTKAITGGVGVGMIITERETTSVITIPVITETTEIVMKTITTGITKIIRDLITVTTIRTITIIIIM